MIPDYRKEYGSRAMHVSASSGTQRLDDYFLKLFIDHHLKIGYPGSAKMEGGKAVQKIVDLCLGLNDYIKARGVQEQKSFEQALREVTHEYSLYKPRTFDDGKDAEEYAEIKNHLSEMASHALLGMREYFGNQEIEGEYKRWTDVDGIDVPCMMYLDYASAKRELDLKCTFPTRNPLKKDGTRSWRIPSPRTEPTENQVIQQAVYNKATGLEPALLFVTSKGFEIATAQTTDLLKKDSLDYHFNLVKQRWLVQQNILKNARGNWRTLFDMVQPDFGKILNYHGPDIHKIAQLQWGIE